MRIQQFPKLCLQSLVGSTEQRQFLSVSLQSVTLPVKGAIFQYNITGFIQRSPHEFEALDCTLTFETNSKSPAMFISEK